MSLPNLISLARLLSAPLIVWLLLEGRMGLAFATFVAAGVSDGVDGYIAKRFGLQTALGAYLDPLADKLLLVTIFVTLGLLDLLPAWLVILVVTRDVLIIGAVLFSAIIGTRVAIRPLFISKVNTAAQIALAGLVLGVHGLGLQVEIPFIAHLAVGATTVASGASYLARWVQLMAQWEDEPPE